MKEWIKAILILPFNVLVIIPALILFLSDYKYSYNGIVYILLGFLFLIAGINLAISTMVLFYTVGKGTPAPWAPPEHLVIEGPYRYIRNPMITAVILVLIGESLILNSFNIFYWAILFFTINSLYFPLFEEKQLTARFGQEYIDYKKRVPRWLPELFRK